MHIIYIILNGCVATVAFEQLCTGESLGWNMMKASNAPKTGAAMLITSTGGAPSSQNAFFQKSFFFKKNIAHLTVGLAFTNS